MVCVRQTSTNFLSVGLKTTSFVLPLFFLLVLISDPVNCHEKKHVFSDIANAFRRSSSFLKPIFLSIFQNHVNRLQPEGKQKDENNLEGPSPLLLLLGLDPDKLQDFVFDGIISAANLIGQIFTKDEDNKRTQRNLEKFSPFRFLLNQPQVVSLLTLMQDPEIVDLLLDEVEEKLEGAECAKLLVCKIVPFVTGMQKSLKFFMSKEKIGNPEDVCPETKKSATCQKEEDDYVRWENSSYEEKMYFFAPTLKEVITHGDQCDVRFPKCVY